MVHIISPKVIPEPVFGTFNARKWMPIIKSKFFKKLYFVHSLGCAWFVYPFANHTRASHCLCTLNLSQKQRVPLWIKHGFINEEQGDAINIYALIHDWKHLAFSHATEAITGIKNSMLGFMMIDLLQKSIEDCGVNAELVKNLFARTDPLYKAISDTNIGIDKFAYLCQDGIPTNVGKPDSVEYLLEHIYFVNGDIVIDTKAIDAAKRLQQFYVTMYKKVYLCKKSVISQRLLQKLIHLSMCVGELTVDGLKEIDDFDLLAKFSTSKNNLIQSLYFDLKNLATFVESIVVLYKKYQPMYSAFDKDVYLFGAQSQTMQKFIKSSVINAKNLNGLQDIESTIAHIAKIPPEMVLIVPVTSPERFEATDIKIYNSQKTLKDYFPNHFADMEDVGKAYATLKVCTTPQYREKLSSPKIARKVYEYLLSIA